jgi:thymidine kinase
MRHLAAKSVLAAYGLGPDFAVKHVHIHDGIVHVALRVVRAKALCPICRHDATRVHSTSVRTLGSIARPRTTLSM